MTTVKLSDATTHLVRALRSSPRGRPV